MDPTLISPNMLSVAKALCTSLLFGTDTKVQTPFDWTPVLANQYMSSYNAVVDFEKVWFTPDSQTGGHLKAARSLFTSSGDAELWLRLCTLDNQPPVRALYPSGTYQDAISVDAENVGGQIGRMFSTDLFDPAAYGPYPVGNDRGTTDDDGIHWGNPDWNLQPWCYRTAGGDASTGPQPTCPPTINDPSAAAAPVRDALGEGVDVPNDAGALPPPACQGSGSGIDYHCWGPVEVDQWATRGAINAGLAVYLYLQQLANQTAVALPPYDKCEALAPPQ
jgi:hypothetical protein